MPEPLFTCSPSRLDNWRSCPRKYRMTYLDSPSLPKGPPWAHNTMGAAIHNALRDWYSLPVEGRTPDSIASLVRVNWRDDGFRDEEQSFEALGRGIAWSQAYVADLDPTIEPRGVERTVSLTTDRLSLQGRVDRIDERDGELVIVDYKTGRSNLTDDDAATSLALAIYAAAATRTLRMPCFQVELHHLPTGEILEHRHTAESLARHLHRADSIGQEAQVAQREFKAGTVTAAEIDQVFPPTPSRLCGYCDFLEHCPEGSATAQRAASWIAIEERPHQHIVDMDLSI
jgi:RecB family exonuclease